MAVFMVWIIHSWLTVTIRERPIGPLSFVVWCLLSYMKFEEDRQIFVRSAMSYGVRLVRRWSVWSSSRRVRMWFMASLIGTDGKRAVASKEIILSCSLSFRFFMDSTNSKEFLQTRALLSIYGLSMSLIWEAMCS